MRITKVIREYMNDTLNEKMAAVNKEARAYYDARRNACIEEIQALRQTMREPIENILRKYGMDTTNSSVYNPRWTFDDVWDMRDSCIQNQSELAIIRNNESDRARIVTRAIHDIELEMALGDDKEKFMEMLEQVVIE